MAHDPAARLQEMKARQFVESSLSSILLEVEEIQTLVASHLDVDAATGDMTDSDSELLSDAAADVLGRAMVKLDQITAALRMAEVDTVAKLSSHINIALQRLIENGRSPSEKERKAVYESFFLLERYLRYMQNAGGDLHMPPVLSPVFFTLASAGLAPFVDEHALAGVGCQWLQAPESFNPPQDITALRTQRRMFQTALIGLLRGSDDLQSCQEQFKLLLHVADRVSSLIENPLNHCSWQLLKNVVDAINDKAIELTPQRRHFFARYDRLLRELEKLDGKTLNLEILESCLAGAGYLLGIADRAEQVQELIPEQLTIDSVSWREEEIIAQRTQIESGLKDALRAVTDVVAGLFNDLKTRMGIMEESEVCEEADVQFLVEKLTAMKSAIAFCGLAEPARQLSEAMELVEDWQVCQPSHEELLKVANIVLIVENLLAGYSLSNYTDMPSSGEASNQEQVLTLQAHQHLYEELRSNISLANRAIGSYMESDFNREHIANISDSLRAATGGFKIIGLELAAELMENCANLLAAMYKSRIPPESGRLETLADSLVSTEYLLHELSEGRSIDSAMQQLLQQNLDAINHQLAAA